MSYLRKDHKRPHARVNQLNEYPIRLVKRSHLYIGYRNVHRGPVKDITYPGEVSHCVRYTEKEPNWLYVVLFEAILVEKSTASAKAILGDGIGCQAAEGFSGKNRSLPAMSKKFVAERLNIGLN